MILPQAEIKVHNGNKGSFVRSTILLIKVAVALKELEYNTKDQIPTNIKSKLQDVLPHLYKSFRVNNTIVNEIQRKRKSEFCQSLGKNLKAFAQLDLFEDYLFDEKTMKGINQDLKKIHGKSKSRSFYQPSEPGAALARPRRPGLNTEAKTAGTTTNGKSTDLDKRTF